MALNINRICSGKCLQVVASFTASINSLSDGMQSGWSSPIIPRLLSPSSPIKIVENDVLWLENGYMLGQLIALIPFAYLSYKIGRKKTILIACATSFLGWILMIFASTAEVLIIARVIGGAGGVTNYITTPAYIAEISHKNIRGRLESIIFIMQPVGILLVYLIGSYVPITNTNIAGAIVVLIQLLTFPIMPESPYCLLKERKEEAARDNLKALRALEYVDEEFNDILANVERVDMIVNSLNCIKKNRKAFLITFVLGVFVGFTGYTVLMMNMEVILLSVSATIPAATFAILFAVMTIVSCLLGALSSDLLGRKALLIVSCFSTSVFLILLAAYFTAKSYGNDVTQFSWMPIVIILCYAITLSGGIGLIPTLLSSEIFHTNVTTFGCAFGTAIYNITAIFSIVLYQYSSTSVGMDMPFYIFGACMFFCGIFCILVVPETRKKTLHEIQNTFTRGSTGDRDRLHNPGNKMGYGSLIP